MPEADNVIGEITLTAKAQSASSHTKDTASAGAIQNSSFQQPGLTSYTPLDSLSGTGSFMSKAEVLATRKKKLTYDFKRDGLADSKIKGLLKFSDKIRKSIPVTSNLGNFYELLNLRLFNLTPGMSKALFPSIEKNAIIANSMRPETQDKNNETAFNMAQIDLLYPGLIDPYIQKINTKRADVINKSVAVTDLLTKGRIGTAEFYNLAKAAGPDVLNKVKDSASAAAIAPLMLTLKSSTIGPALDALGRAFDSQTMSQEQINSLRQIGIAPVSASYNASPALRFNAIIVPAMKAHGYDTSVAQKKYLNTFFKGSKYQPALQPLIDKLSQIEDYSKRYKQIANDPRNSVAYIAANDTSLATMQGNASSNEGVLEGAGSAARFLVTKAGPVLNFKTNHPMVDFVSPLAAPIAFHFLSKKIAPHLAGISHNFVKTALPKIREAALAGLAVIGAGVEGYACRKPIKHLLHKVWTSKPMHDYSIPPGGEYHAVLDPYAYNQPAFEVAPMPAKQATHDTPTPVFIVNAGDVHNATAKALANQLNVQAGPTGFNPHLTLSMPSANH